MFSSFVRGICPSFPLCRCPARLNRLDSPEVPQILDFCNSANIFREQKHTRKQQQHDLKTCLDSLPLFILILVSRQQRTFGPDEPREYYGEGASPRRGCPSGTDARNANLEVRNRPDQLATCTIGFLAEIGAVTSPFHLNPSLAHPLRSESASDRRAAVPAATKRRPCSIRPLRWQKQRPLLMSTR